MISVYVAEPPPRPLFAEVVPMVNAHWPDSNLMALKGVAERLGIEWRDLLAVMANESGCLPDPPHHGPARGLIQFEPDTLDRLGWKGRPDDFARALDVAEQLDYVERYFAPYARAGLLQGGGVGVLYTATFLPALLHHAQDPNYPLCGRLGPLAWAYQANRGFDRTGKGTITPADLATAAEAALTSSPIARDILRRMEQLEEDPPTMVVDVTDGGQDLPVFGLPPENDSDEEAS